MVAPMNETRIQLRGLIRLTPLPQLSLRWLAYLCLFLTAHLRPTALVLQVPVMLRSCLRHFYQSLTLMRFCWACVRLEILTPRRRGQTNRWVRWTNRLRIDQLAHRVVRFADSPDRSFERFQQCEELSSRQLHARLDTIRTQIALATRGGVSCSRWKV